MGGPPVSVKMKNFIVKLLNSCQYPLGSSTGGNQRGAKSPRTTTRHGALAGEASPASGAVGDLLWALHERRDHLPIGAISHRGQDAKGLLAKTCQGRGIAAVSPR